MSWGYHQLSDLEANTDAEMSGDMFDLLKWNITDNDEMSCLDQFIDEPYPPLSLSSDVADDAVFCNRTWDSVLCWPTTVAGSTAVLPCSFNLNGVAYDPSQNATRVCLVDGTWANKTDYNSCKVLNTDTASLFPSEDTIYFTGYAISIVFLTVALWIFTHFKDLHCLRNTIHAHLFVTYIMADLTWIVITIQIHSSESKTGACIITIFLHYFQLTNFCWMFVEGFYLYMLVVETFSADKIKMRIYTVIGWGVPLPIVVVWAVVKANWTIGKDLEVFLLNNCPWMTADSYDWIYRTPEIIVLFVNILFLFKIMWVLITKLRSANSVETQQYRKGSKALLVLIPLLGLTHVLVIAGPTMGMSRIIFDHIQAVLLSTQGFTVTLFYCFLNTEVRNAVRHHWQRWRTRHGLHQLSRRRTGGAGGSSNVVTTTTSIGYTGGAAGAAGVGSGLGSMAMLRGGSRTVSESTSFQDPRCDVHHHHHHHHLHSYKDEPACCESAASTYPLTASAHLGGASSSVLSGNGYSGLSRLANGSPVIATTDRYGTDSANLLVCENQV